MCLVTADAHTTTYGDSRAYGHLNNDSDPDP
jgi:hypothetical protein